MKRRIVILGSGNVSTSLALALKGKCEIVQIYSRTPANAQALALQVGCEACSDLKDLVLDADIYIVSVKDDAIASMTHAVPDNGALWLHTSGSTPINVFHDSRAHYGVLYPLQTFTKSHRVILSETHFFVEGSDSISTQEIMEIAMLMSNHVHEASSADRERLHIAAVFASNFANHMFTLASEVLDEAGLPFDALRPLIKTTVAKLDCMKPAESQTGPAARGDVKIIKQHLATLHGDKRKIYRLLSQNILSMHS